MNIGYVGLGAMGGALARHLVKDHSLIAWDLDRTAVDPFVAMGASTTETLAELARQSDIVFLCLPRSANVEQAIFGTGGLVEGLAAGSIVIDQTSGMPKETRRFAEKLAGTGVKMLDAPVAGGVPAALAGRVTIMVSGPQAAYREALPAMKAITAKVYKAGDRVGDAQATKLANNAINAGYRIATLEVVALGRKLGFSLPVLTDLINDGCAANFSSRVLLKAMVERKSSTDFALALMIKDLNQALVLGAEVGVPMPLVATARGLMQIGLNQMGKSARLDDVVPFIGSVSGVDLDGHGDGPSPSGRAAEEISVKLVNALALCNRLVVHEGAAMLTNFGIAPDAFAEIINNGSGWSVEAERVLPARSGGSSTNPSNLDDAVRDLGTVTRLGPDHDVPMMMAGVASALCDAEAVRS